MTDAKVTAPAASTKLSEGDLPRWPCSRIAMLQGGVKADLPSWFKAMAVGGLRQHQGREMNVPHHNRVVPPVGAGSTVLHLGADGSGNVVTAECKCCGERLFHLCGCVVWRGGVP